MALKFSIKRERVEFADDDYVEVRGLTLPDISVLVDAHTETVTEIFNKFTGRDPESFTSSEIGSVAKELLLRFPAVTAHVIALAAEATEHFDDISRLPPDVQIVCLEKVGHLTFQMQGGLGNFAETVLRLMQGANGLAAKVKSPLNSQSGSTGSIGK